MEFNAAVKSDSAGQLRGAVKCRLTPGGLSIAKGKQQPLMVPRGAGARYDGGNRFTVDAGGGRALSLAVNKFGSYQHRLAREVAGYVGGGRPAPDAAEFKIEPYLLVPAVLPFGIMLVTGGGAIWGAVGGVLAVLCLLVAQAEQLPKAARLAIIAVVNVVAYAAVITLVVLAARAAPAGT